MEKKSSKYLSNINGAMRPIDVYFKQYNQVFAGSTVIILLILLLVLFYLGLTGLCWTIPFPHLGFLGSYNGYINWASFLIAGLMFFWYRQSALLSYFLLIMLFGVSYGDTLILAGHPTMNISGWIIFGMLVIATSVGLIKIMSKRSLNIFFSLLYIPLWLVHFIARRLNVRY